MLKIIAILAALSATAAQADSTAGTASVIDGDTIEIHGQRIRLQGIDAPEGKQRCYLHGRPWRCGTDASNALADLIGRSPVNCEVVDVDRYQRLVAICAVRGVDLGDWMVRHGWAMAYRRYSKAYISAEDEARAAGRGIWASEFEAPWDWRKSH